ncbi:flagellar motor switch protein FliN [Sulfurimonas sp.]|jgi:flagellar motor switch protein FliN/FliY|uniref:flagellar motor switch protein FliN n=1 Tax=Sulfurimonas sp. TaxID=2022749 RepID=UPI0025E54C98|nr:flagellar motor switch protein FliN [Sulfurimonas sp.]MBT5935120.1 flagellar motor switch protein FliN [Sulfurimonas sp.]
MAKKLKHNFLENHNYNEEELSWMDYSGVLDMQVEFVADLGETKLTLGEILKLDQGSIIDLKKPAGESVESYVNGRILGKGEVMVYEKNLAIRINEVLDSSAVLYHLSKEKL